MRYVTFGGSMKLFSHYIENQAKLNSEIRNWTNHIVGDTLSYSYRDTTYDSYSFPTRLHSHDYYELVIFEEGDIHYICDGNVYYPSFADMMLVPPGKFHVTVPDSEQTRYKRHVFYFYPSAFDSFGHRALMTFLSGKEKGELITFCDAENCREFTGILECLKKLWSGAASELEDALGLSYVIHLFYLFNNKSCQTKNSISSLPEKVLELQKYIDDNYSQISSVSEVAGHFFYSREYVSRLFKKHFDTTISDYITKRRVAESQLLIMQEHSMIDVSYRVGFGSLSTFIRAFRSVTNMTPSEYRKMRRRDFVR